ncbi:hypothetical protein ACFO0N_21895 [Halobium salinum]|uniref:Uncharacterized protein n=1 Tax=Halobium salinum TaxID=1364940 RepID=A0ABD5PJT3_9EURY|nr:hypothetical protein [Halobium salinum]
MRARSITALHQNERDAAGSDEATFEERALVKQGVGIAIASGARRITVGEVTFCPNEETVTHVHPFGWVIHVTAGKMLAEQWADESLRGTSTELM